MNRPPGPMRLFCWHCGRDRATGTASDRRFSAAQDAKRRELARRWVWHPEIRPAGPVLSMSSRSTAATSIAGVRIGVKTISRARRDFETPAAFLHPRKGRQTHRSRTLTMRRCLFRNADLEGVALHDGNLPVSRPVMGWRRLRSNSPAVVKTKREGAPWLSLASRGPYKRPGAGGPSREVAAWAAQTPLGEKNDLDGIPS